jgi:hypothetical protein
LRVPRNKGRTFPRKARALRYRYSVTPATFVRELQRRSSAGSARACFSRVWRAMLHLFDERVKVSLRPLSFPSKASSCSSVLAGLLMEDRGSVSRRVQPASLRFTSKDQAGKHALLGFRFWSSLSSPIAGRTGSADTRLSDWSWSSSLSPLPFERQSGYHAATCASPCLQSCLNAMN